MEQIFHLGFRTMTKAVMEENRIVSTVALVVMMAEFMNTRPKFIFFMASGKFFRVKPWAPMMARGLEVISALVLKTLMMTRTKGKMKHRNNTSRITHMMIGNLNEGMNIFLDWNLLLDQVGGPNHVKNYCDAPFLFHTEKEKPTQQEIQTYLNHFSHNIQPGAVRIGFSRYTDKIELTAFRKDSTIIVILLNRTEEELPAYLRLHDQCAKITVAPRSIASAVISDCVPVLSPWQRLS